MSPSIGTLRRQEISMHYTSGPTRLSEYPISIIGKDTGTPSNRNKLINNPGALIVPGPIRIVCAFEMRSGSEWFPGRLGRWDF